MKSPDLSVVGRALGRALRWFADELGPSTPYGFLPPTEQHQPFALTALLRPAPDLREAFRKVAADLAAREQLTLEQAGARIASAFAASFPQTISEIDVELERLNGVLPCRTRRDDFVVLLQRLNASSPAPITPRQAADGAIARWKQLGSPRPFRCRVQRLCLRLGRLVGFAA